MIVRRKPSISYTIHSDTTVSWSTMEDCKKKLIKRKVYWASCLFAVGIFAVLCKLASLRGPVKAVVTNGELSPHSDNDEKRVPDCTLHLPKPPANWTTEPLWMPSMAAGLDANGPDDYSKALFAARPLFVWHRAAISISKGCRK